MKRVILLVLYFIGLSLWYFTLYAMGQDIGADKKTEVLISAPERVAWGSYFDVNVVVKNGKNVAGFEASILFNRSVLRVREFYEGTFLSGAYWLGEDIDNSAGRIDEIVCVRLQSGGITGDGTLFKITFKARQLGSSYIKFENLKVANASGLVIPVKVTEAVVTVKDAPPWDVNIDDIVDILDFVIVGQHFGERVTDDIFPNPDVNGDGVVNVLDLAKIGKHYGEDSSDYVGGERPDDEEESDIARLAPSLIRLRDMAEPQLGKSDPNIKLLNRLIFGLGAKTTTWGARKIS